MADDLNALFTQLREARALARRMESEVETLVQQSNESDGSQLSFQLRSAAEGRLHAAEREYTKQENLRWQLHDKWVKQRDKRIHDEMMRLWRSNEQKGSPYDHEATARELVANDAEINGLRDTYNEHVATLQRLYSNLHTLRDIAEREQRKVVRAAVNPRAPDIVTLAGLMREEDVQNRDKFSIDTESYQSSFYVGTALIPKKDGAGRHWLVDIRIYEGQYIYLVLSGSKTPVVLAKVYFDNDEEYRDGDDRYFRQHGGPGARFHGFTLGLIAYMSTAHFLKLAFKKLAGSASPGSGPRHNRTDFAADLWDSMHERGTTQRKQLPVTKSHSERVCLPLPSELRQRSLTVKLFQGGRYRNVKVEGRVESDKPQVCGSVSYLYPASTQSVDLLSGDTLTKSPFFVFGRTDHTTNPNPHGGLFDSSWTINPATKQPYEVQPEAWASDTGLDLRGSKKLLNANLDKSGLPLVRKATAELLARAYHGASPYLALTIAHTLKRSGFPDLMQQYLLRPDVYEVVGHLSAVAELLGQQRLPGINGLGQVESRLGRRLNVAPLSEETRLEVEQYADLPEGGLE